MPLLAVLLFSLLATPSSLAAPSWPSVSGPLTNARLGKNDVALVAGVGRPFVLPAIPGASEAATDWYRFFVEGRGVPVEQVVVLRDAEVTKESLLQEAARLRGALGPGGTFWLVFIGHGAPSLRGDDGLLLGVDVQPTVRSIEDRGLSQEALLAAAGAGTVSVTAIFDACFSGVRSDGSGKPLVPGAQATLPLRRRTSTSTAAAPLTILQASEQVAGPLPGHDRPAFSYLLLGGLRGWADDDGDSAIKIGEAFAYTKKLLTITVRDRAQVPVLVGRGDAVVWRGRPERGPDLGGLVTTPAAPATTTPITAPTKKRRSSDTFDQVAAEEVWKKRRVVATSSGFVRGAYATAVDEASILREAEPLAPEAVGVVRELGGRMGTSIGAALGVFAAVGTGAGIGGGVLFYNIDPDPLGATVGAAIGVVVGLIAGGITGLVVGPSETDMTRLSSARSDVAEAVNVAERERLGL